MYLFIVHKLINELLQSCVYSKIWGLCSATVINIIIAINAILVVHADRLQNQLGPRYEGQLIFMVEPIPHSKRLPRTPSRSSSCFAVDGRAD